MICLGSFRRSAPKAEPTDTQTHIAWVVAGLGNPDERYRRSRHNLGFMALDRLAQRHRVGLDERRFKAHLGRGVLDGQAVMLAQPQTFMNSSGDAVTPISASFKDQSRAFDRDPRAKLDLAAGTLRIKRGGSTHEQQRRTLRLSKRWVRVISLRIQDGRGRTRRRGRDAVG